MTTKKDVIDYLSTKEEITEEQYKSLTADMSNEEIEANFKVITKSEYSSVDSTSYERKEYYKISTPSDDDINSLLLYKLCKKQDETNTRLKSIRSMLIFFTALTVISIIAGIYLATQII